MARYSVIKLSNLSRLHIGTGRESYDFSASELHSDTLSSALLAVRTRLGRLNDMESFLNSFVISSAFPYWRDYYFLPKLIGHLDNLIVDGYEPHGTRKRLKKIKYIESSIWQSLLKGKTVHVNLTQINGSFLLPEDAEDGFISKSEVSQRVRVSRTEGEDAEPFFFDWRYFDKEAGLYCLVDAADEVRNELLELFQILGSFGLGTDRSVGGGQFDVCTSTMELLQSDMPDGVAVLSLFIPAEDEFAKLNLERSRYNLLRRGGYMSGSSEESLRHLRKRTIYMFDVGSVFVGPTHLNGTVVNLRPEWNDESMHDVFRSGRPFCIPINTSHYE